MKNISKDYVILLKNIDIEISESPKLFNKFDINFKFYTSQESIQDIQDNFIKHKNLNKVCNLKLKNLIKLVNILIKK